MFYALLWAVFGVLCLAVPVIAYFTWLLGKPWVQIGLTTDNEPILTKFSRKRHAVAEVYVRQQTRDIDREFERGFPGV